MEKRVALYQTNIDTEYYRKKILKNELKIITKYPPKTWDLSRNFDGGTGLGFNSLTSRSCHFNLLKWFGTKSIRKCIREKYNHYTNKQNKSIYVQCWANVMRYGEKIKPHSHDDLLPSIERVSGHIVVYADTLTNTYYENNPVQNINGQLTLFPSNLVHWTDTYLGNSERITIAFDIKTYEDWKYEVFDAAKSHWVKL